MNLATRVRILVVIFWAIGMPLIVLSFVAIPLALNPAAPASRLLWILVPVLGLAVSISCIRALLRMSALVARCLNDDGSGATTLSF